MVPVIVGAVVTPLSIGLGAVLLGTFDGSEAAGTDVPSSAETELKPGDVGVPVVYAKLLRDVAADCDEKELTAPVLAAQLKRESDFDPRARSLASEGPAEDEGSLTDPRSEEQRAQDEKAGGTPAEEDLSGGDRATGTGADGASPGTDPPGVAQAERPVTRGIAQFSDADWAADGIDGALNAERMTNRTLTTSCARNFRCWGPLIWSSVMWRVVFLPSAVVMTASMRCGSAASERSAGLVEMPDVMRMSSSRVGSWKRASTHSPSAPCETPGPHQLLLTLSKRSFGGWPPKDREATAESGLTWARLAKWSRAAFQAVLTWNAA